MDYYNIKVLNSNEVIELRSFEDFFNSPLVRFGRYTKNRTNIFGRFYEYLAVSAEDEGARTKFEDRCRRHLYKMATIKMGYSEHNELEMIRTEKKVQMLRALLELAVHPFRADQHILQKIDRDNLLEMFQRDLSLVFRREFDADESIAELMNHLRSFLDTEMKSHKKGRCEFFKLENMQGRCFSRISIQEKFYFVHNAKTRRIFILKFNPVRVNWDHPLETDYPSESLSGTESSSGTESDTGNETVDECEGEAGVESEVEMKL